MSPRATLRKRSQEFIGIAPQNEITARQVFFDIHITLNQQLAAISNALFASGGITPVGSMRNIQLRRDGNTVTTLDLYDFLLRGDTRRKAERHD